MRTDLELTEEVVKIYRDIYYDHYKPLLKKHENDQESPLFLKEFLPVLNRYGWDLDLFLDFKSIDMMQRLVFEYSHELMNQGLRSEPMTSRPEYRHYDPNHGALRLKCPIRSEDKDIIN